MAKRYSAKFKFQVVLELLQGDLRVGQVAKAYDIHPNTASGWKETFLEKGPEVFSQNSTIAEYEKRLSQLERLLGQKEVEIALLKNFLGQTK